MYCFVGLRHFFFFQDVLVVFDIDFRLLYSFGPENMLYATILTTEKLYQ